MTTLHNGGPPLVDDVPAMTYFKFYPSDWLAGTADMTAEERGIYITALCVMYDRMGGMPFDERKGAPLMRVDIRIYRRVRDKLIADGKFVRDGDLIRNMRVEKEITDYVIEFRRRSEAAKKREAERKLHRTSAELPANLSETSPELLQEVLKKLSELDGKNPTKTTKQETQDDHILEARSQKPEVRKEREGSEVTPLSPPLGGKEPSVVFEAGRLTVLNGTAAQLADEFPGINLQSVCNLAAKEVVQLSDKSPDAMLAIIRSRAQSEADAAAKRSEKPKREKPKVAMPPKSAWDGDRLRKIAEEQGMSLEDSRNEFEAFKTHHLANGNKFADWYRAWQTWCINYSKRGYGRKVAAKPSKSPQFGPAPLDYERMIADLSRPKEWGK